MLTVISGAFRSGIEDAFLAHVQNIKKDPLAKVLIVTPSSRLADRLQKALAGGGGAYLNLHFHTFASLAELIVDAQAPLEKPLLSDALFFDTLVKQIVREDKPFDVFEELAVPEGFPPAVRGTLRDLLDAGIDQENVDALIQEGFAGTDVDLGSLRSLLNLHRLYLRRLSKLSVLPRSGLFAQAIKIVPQSVALKEFHEILYYGFYDLTGIQADFFQAVVKSFPSRFFFPYVHSRPAYGFAKRFRDVFVQPVMKEETVLDPSAAVPPVQIFNVSGLRDEAWLVANEIRRLHDENGLSFSEIAVVARTKDRLGFLIQEALAERGIPASPSFYPSLAMFPETQEWLKTLQARRPDDGPLTWQAAVDLAEELLPDASNRMREVIRSLAKVGEIVKKIEWDAFVETLRDRCSRVEVREDVPSDAGVSLLYAEAARGLPFKAVFLIGLEEKVFPRIIREDPFLRDDAREALNGIGHKISKKMTAFEEERLLFELAVKSASEHLVLISQRSDDEGSVVGASPFLRAFAEERGISLDREVVSLPRPLVAKIKEAAPVTLGASDVTIGFLAAGREADALRLAESIGRDKAGLERGLRLLKAVNSFKDPGLYDSLIGKMGVADVFRKGKISASALENYAGCGYRYFASKMLGLAPLDTEEMEDALSPLIRGRVAHAFIETFFRRATKDGTAALPEKLPMDLFAAIFDETITTVPPEDAKVPSVMWRAARESLRATLAAFFETEFASLRAAGATPLHFEAEVEGTLPPPLDGFVWTGKIDRIDGRGAAADIIDYKTGKPFAGTVLTTLAKKGEKLQAPLYLLLARRFLEKMGRQAAEMTFRYEFVEHVDEVRAIDPEDWALHGAAIQSKIRSLVDAAVGGNFAIKPGRQCDYCEVARACRKNHGLSVYRAEQAAPK